MLVSFGLVFALLRLTSSVRPSNLNSGLTQSRLKGFPNTYWTSSLVLCPSNMEYRIADELVPIFFELGFSPNGIVFLTCCVRVLCIRVYLAQNYNMVALLLSVVQVLDAADGQLARAYGMESKFGGILDHAADTVFTVCFMAFTM